MLKDSISKLLDDFIKRYNDVYKHFITKKKVDEAEFCQQAIDKVLKKTEITFTKAEISSGKSDSLSSEEVI